MTSRRALLGIAGAAAAAVALKPDAAQAADGGNMKLGMDNQTTSQTYLTGGRNGGLFVTSTTDDGSVVGYNTADDGDGLRGTGGRAGVNGIGTQIGVSAGSDTGVAMQAETWSGTAVLANAAGPGSTALNVQGAARFSNSGRVRVSAGANKVVIPVTAAMVLATLQGYQAGLHVAGVVLSRTTATIRLSKATTAPIDVAWFALG
jgi:hypothetical protein